MNTLSSNPYLKRRKKLEDKERYLIERDPKDKKPPRRKLRIIDVVNTDPEELEDKLSDV